MIKSLSETRTTFKLQSYRGAVLGTITVPERWAKFLHTRGSYEFCIAITLRSIHDDTEATLRQAVLTTSECYPGAVELIGCSLEEFERVPGCSFAPGAAYLRSIIE